MTYDRDNPFPLFAEVRSAAPVHEVRLADGHPAWLVVGHDEAKAALNDPRLSKDMHAALAHSGEVVAEGLPGPAFARHMLAVDPPRPHPAAAAGDARVHPEAGRRTGAPDPVDRGRPARRLWRPAVRTSRWTWWRASRSRCRSR